jgi:hypothetical protein
MKRQKIKYKDHPWDEVTKEADRLIHEGKDVYQKFTCSGCGQRLTMPDANVFHKTGTCDQCSAVTDIVKQGCNYMVTFNTTGRGAMDYLDQVREKLRR